MKRSILQILGLTFIISLSISSCELLDCKTCELVTTNNGVETGRGPGLLFCGDELAEKESYSEQVGSIYTFYDCQ